MIHAVTANKESFHPVEFREGLNLIVAERSNGSSETASRNGLGKTTLFRIIDFCLGSDVRGDKDSILKPEFLPEWEFTLDIDLRGRRVKVMREVDNDEVIHVTGNVEGWPVPPESTTDGVANYSLNDWRTLLGWAFFDLPMQRDVENSCKIPTARSLISFFIRKQFVNPLLPTVAPGVDELAIAYLLGLNWDYLSRLDTLKKTEKDAKAVKRAANIDLERWEKTERALRAECNALESDMAHIKEELAHFNVLPGFEEIERKANALTVEIHGLKNKMISAKNRLDNAKRQLVRERASLLPVEDIYRESGLAFPDTVKETLENVKRFHEAVTGNRRIILEREIHALERTITEVNARVLAKSEERRQAMQVLQTGRALDEFTALNQRYTDMAKQLQEKLDCLRHLSSSKDSLAHIKERKVEMGEAAKVEYEELRPTWSASEEFFRELTGRLYGTPGSLNIKIVADSRKYGFSFEPRLGSDTSEGIKKIKIFSFDATLFHHQRVCEHPIDFLIHDSVVYDSTDPRQVANAMLEADRVSRELHGQYICAINSDKLNEREFKELMSVEQSQAFTRLTLSDASDADKLLGITVGRSTVIPTASTIAVPVQRVVDGESSEPPQLPPPEDNQ